MLLKKCDFIASARLEIQHIPGFPRFLYFFDPAFIPIEITDGAIGHNIINRNKHSVNAAMKKVNTKSSFKAQTKTNHYRANELELKLEHNIHDEQEEEEEDET